MHPEEKWLPGKVVRPFKPGAAGELTLQDDSVRGAPRQKRAQPVSAVRVHFRL